MANDRTPSTIFLDPGRSPGAFTHVKPVPAIIIDDPLALFPGGWPRSTATSSPAKKVAGSDAQRFGVFYGHALMDWFDHMHVVPRAFDFGNLLSDQSVPIEVYSAFRSAPHSWLSFVNNAGLGVDLVGQPSLPVTVFAQSGIQMTLDVSTSGDPFVDDTLDFVFDVSTIEVPIEIQRIVLWGLRPEQEYTETLSFMTDVQRSKSGSEKRVSLRQNPRQTYGYRYIAEEGLERQTLENLLFDWQGRTFGVPVWFDECFLTVAASSGALSLTVDQTAFRDFRIGGLVCVFTSQGLFDVTEVTSIGATTIGLASPLINSYAVGVSVFPLRVCEAQPMIQGGRYTLGLSTHSIDFLCAENDVALANLAPFSSFNGKLLLDVGNSVLSQTVQEAFRIELDILDNETGLRIIGSSWDRHKRGHTFSMRAYGRQAVWQMRGLVHAIRGQQISFYAPRSSDDLQVTANLLSGSNTMTIAAVGYSQFVRQRQPKNVLRLTFADGVTAPLLRTIIGSSAPGGGVEQLVLDANWPSTITPAQVARIEYVEKLRFESDDVKIHFRPQAHLAHLIVPVQAVFE